MMFVMLVAGIGLVLAGLLAIAFGIPVKEFSTGNTLIIAGMIGVCTGAIMLGLWMAVRELKNIARRLGTGMPEARGEAAVRPVLAVAAARDSAPADGGFPAADDRRSRSLLASGTAGFRAGAAAVAERGCPARSPDSGADAPRTAAAGRKAEAQFDVFVDVAKRARARPGAVRRAAAAGPVVVGPSPQAARRAAGRTGRTAAGTVRRCLAESGTRKARRNSAAAAQRPHAPDARETNGGAGARPRISRR